MKECDVNKDIEIDRFELALSPNQPIEMALEQIRTQVTISESVLSLKQVKRRMIHKNNEIIVLFYLSLSEIAAAATADQYLCLSLDLRGQK